MEKNWIIREARLEDKDSIQALHQSVYGWSMEDALFNRLYQDNPAGEGRIWVAEDTETSEIVGSIAFFPCSMIVAGNVMLGSQPDYWIVAQGYRRQGVLRALHRRGAMGMRRRGIPFTYFFAPQAWAAYFMRPPVESFVIARMRWLARPLDVRPILSRLPSYMAKGDRKAGRQRKNLYIVLEKFLESRLLLTTLGWVGNPVLRILYLAKSVGALKSNLLCHEIESFDARFDELWEKTAGTHRVAIVRNRDYLNWRYSHHPSRRHCILCAESDRALRGYVILLAGRVVRIMDLLAIDEGTADFLIRSAVAYALRQGSAMVAVRLLEGNYYLEAFRRNGFYLVPERLSPRGLFGFWLNLEIEELELLKDAKNWFMMEGDWDWSEPV